MISNHSVLYCNKENSLKGERQLGKYDGMRRVFTGLLDSFFSIFYREKDSSHKGRKRYGGPRRENGVCVGVFVHDCRDGVFFAANWPEMG